MKTPQATMNISKFPRVALCLTITLTMLLQTQAEAADLTAELYPPVVDVMTNDWSPYTLRLKNLGPDATNGAVAVFQFPNAALIDVRPASTVYTYVAAGHYIQITPGNLTNSEVRDYTVRVRSDNTTASTFQFSIQGGQQPNDSMTLPVQPGIMTPAQLVARTNSAMVFNPTLGLMEQSILLSNAGPVVIESARVVITSLGTNQLSNAAGTNGGNPFVIYGGKLAPGQSVNLFGQFFNSSGLAFPIQDSQFQTYVVPPAGFSAAAVLGVGTPIKTYRMLRHSSGNPLLEFKTTPGRSYTVVYSDNPEFGNPLVVPTSLLAGASAKQWIDYGPPATISAPDSAKPRYYRVYLNP